MNIIITVIEDDIIPRTPNHPNSHKEESSIFIPHVSIPSKGISTMKGHVKIMDPARAPDTS
jgi:hypothetical protein